MTASGIESLTFRFVPQCLKRHRTPQRHGLPWLNFSVFSQSIQANVVMEPQNLASAAMASCYTLSVSLFTNDPTTGPT